MGNLLNIKPIIFVNDDGVYQTLAKARGYKAAVETMVQEAVSGALGKARAEPERWCMVRRWKMRRRCWSASSSR